MYPVLFTIGQLTISPFGILFAVGFILGVFYVFRLARNDIILIRNNVTEEIILDMIVMSSFFGLLGARFFYVVTHFGSFGFDILKWVLFTYFPGLNLLGGIIFSLGFLILISKARNLPTLLILDFATIGFLIAAPFGFLGTFLTGVVGRFPVHLVLAILMIIFLGIYFYVEKKSLIRQDGIITLTFLGVFAIVTFGFDFARSDRILLRFLSFNQLISIIVGLSCLIGIIIMKKKTITPFLKKRSLLW